MLSEGFYVLEISLGNLQSSGLQQTPTSGRIAGGHNGGNSNSVAGASASLEDLRGYSQVHGRASVTSAHSCFPA